MIAGGLAHEAEDVVTEVGTRRHCQLNESGPE